MGIPADYAMAIGSSPPFHAGKDDDEMVEYPTTPSSFSG